jgi:lipid A 3-O-deacylase
MNITFHGLSVSNAWFSTLVAIASIAPLCGQAASEPASPEIPQARENRGIWSFVFENDVFAQADRHYTNGVRLARLIPKDDDPETLKRAALAFPLLSTNAAIRTEWSVGQSMFTPRRITDAIPNPLDRPYAGWLYATFGLIAEDGNRLEQLQSSIGVIGPWSLAEDTQKAVHRLTESDRPLGWHAQLRTEPTVQGTYQRSWRRFLAADNVLQSGYGMDATTHSGLSVGNVFIYGNAGATVRFGKDLPVDYGPPRVQPSLPGSGFFTRPLGDAFGWYLYAGLDSRLVARNLFLDGNTFRDSPSVEKRNVVHDLQVGATLSWKSLQISYTHVWRSTEFHGQPVPDRFGVLSATWIWK